MTRASTRLTSLIAVLATSVLLLLLGAAPGAAQAVAGVPGAATAVTATKDDTAHTATVTWKAPSSDGGSPITGYRLVRLTTAGPTVGSTTVGPGIRSRVYTNLAPGTTLIVAVIPLNAAGSGPARTTSITMAQATLTTDTPTITGTAQVGSILTAHPGTWGPPPVSFSFQWYAGSTRILGATGSVYTPTSTDVGKPLKVQVTGAKPGYASSARFSAPTAPVLRDVPVVPGAVSSTVITQDDRDRTATLTWTPPFSDGGSPVTGYRVTRNGTDASGNGPLTVILGPDARSWTAVDLARETTYELTVAAINAVGTGAPTTEEVTLRLGVITPVAPVIVGTPQVGSTLTVDAGTWEPQPVTLTYQWNRYSTPIPGATGRSYTLVADDAGQAISVTVTGSKPGYPPTSITSPQVTVTLPEGSRVVDVAAGDYHSLAVTADGRVFAWGANFSGQLGDGTTTDRPTPVAVAGITDAVAVAAGQGFSLAATADGHVYAWGQNQYGQLGDGTTTDRRSPALVAGVTDAVDVTAALTHALALTADGRLYAWGDNTEGALGDGTDTHRYTPIVVPGLSDVVSVSTSYSHSLAATADGSVYHWGYFPDGGLGDGNPGRYTPARVSGIPPVVSVAAGGSHALAVGADGRAYTWGANMDGQFGNGTRVANPAPAPVRHATRQDLTGIVEVAGAFHSLAVTSSGELFVWGRNERGQLGLGVAGAWESWPTLNPAISGIRSVAVSYQHSLAVTADGRVYAWGVNERGQLGDGSIVNRRSPVVVGGIG
ncbi:fibronectin type III domain-containing protein [Microbacterium sp. AZCO]|uniref:RCC1 domain-containing protein n=1 Tax=Microbacterium sp. AZCO TaxID=3142976 RepID=UPI0031F3455E